MLFNSFIELCEGLVSSKRQRVVATGIEMNPETSQKQQTSFATCSLPDRTTTPSALADSLEAPVILPSFPEPFDMPLLGLADPSGGTPGSTDLGWGLFDVQPTLDWLDADFSFFDNEQSQ